MQDLLRAAAPYVGVPYVLRGREPTGWDCWGLVRCLRLALLGKPSPCFSDSYDVTDAVGGGLPALAEALIRSQLAAWRRYDAAAPGRVALFEVFGREAHVGLVLTDNDFIHAWEGSGTVISRLDAPTWARRIRGFHDAD